MKTQLLAIILSLCLLPNEAYRILCLFPFNGRSHFTMFGPLCRGLAKRGHQVDMISHFPAKEKIANYTDIVNLEGSRKNLVNSFSIDYAVSLNENLVHKIVTVFGRDFCYLMEHEGMQKFIKNPPKYDVVITEYFGAQCYFGFGPYLKAPVIAAISALDSPHATERVGNPWSNAFYPGGYTSKATLKTFWDRLENTLTNFLLSRMYNNYISEQTEIMRKYLSKDLPDIDKILNNIALMLVNTHWSFHGVRPLTPAMIEVGGLHCEGDESKLSPDLQKWMDNASAGVVYFTLGSLVNIETLPKETILGVYESFRKIAPVKVLMKIANRDRLPPGLPDNVMTSSWIPQISVLRHKNTRVFITHGGLMGSQEALYYGVPVIGIPLFADQIRNVNVFVHKRVGVRMEYHEISEKSMDKALDTLLNDPAYRSNMKKASAIFKDRPMSAMDTAIFWVEFVIRNGPQPIRSPVIDMPWWKKYLIDIYVFLLVCASLAIYLIRLLLKTVLSAVWTQDTKKDTREKKRN